MLIGATLTAASASAQNEGTVVGQVVNEATGKSLASASVTVEGTAVSAVTGLDGRFVLLRVPAGPRIVRVVYTGLNPGSVAITVSAGPNTAPPISLSSEVYKMDKMVVAGVREGNALAIAAQRSAPNFKTVVATDAYGNLADGNLGEFLKRVAGVGVGDAVDEVTQVRVRGAAAAQTAVTMDGTRLPSPQARSDGREFAIDQLPADFIERIEVIKAPTPDMDGDAIGGTVNLITKSAFDTQRRYVQYTMGVNYRTLGGYAAPFGSAQFSDVFGSSKNLGVFVTASYSKTDRPGDFIELQYDAPAGVPNLRSFRLQPGYKNRERTGVGVRFDYRLSANSSLSAGFMYNFYEARDELRRWTTMINNNATGRLPGGTDTATTLTAGGEQMQSNVILDYQRVYSFQMSGKSLLQNGTLKIDYGAAVAPASGWQTRDLFQVRGVNNQRRTLLREPGSYFVTTELISGTDILDYNRANQNDITYETGDSRESIWGLHLNAQKTLPTALPAYIKAGFRHRGQSRSRSYDRWEGIHLSGPRGPFDANKFKSTDTSSINRLFGGRYETLVTFGDPRAAVRSFFQQPQEWNFLAVDSVGRSAREDGKVREDVTAGYLMSDVKIGRLGILAGLRMEQTDITGESPSFVPILPALPSTASIDQQVARRRAEWSNTAKTERSYRNWFPGAHLRYSITDGLMARASVSQGIGRPNFANLKPLTTVDIASLSIRQNNTGLKPQESRNYDVGLEYYFEPVGLLSATVFKKEIKNFISTINTPLTAELANQFGVDPQYLGYDFRTQTNTGDGEINGFEIAYNQNLGGFADWLRPFSVNANYTKAKGKGLLEEIIPVIWNFGVVYEQRPWTARVQLNYQDTFLSSTNIVPLQRRFKMEQYNLDLSLQYRFKPWLSLFVDYQNALGEVLKVTTGEGLYLPQQYVDIGKRVNFGIKGRF